MTKASFTRPHSAASLSRPGGADPQMRADRTIRIDRADAERIEGRMRRGDSAKAPTSPRAPALSRLLDRRVRKAKGLAGGHGPGGAGPADLRQQALVKLHYFNHSRGGGLAGHVRYVARESASLEDELAEVAPRENRMEDHATYLGRGDKANRDPFYTADADRVDGLAMVGGWSDSDKRHFRIVLAAEEGASLRDLRSYTREVLTRAETALGRPLVWVAVDHWDTDNPHTHIILRGRDAQGRDLVLPKEFVRHGLRGIARDVATERLGSRTREQADAALDRETRRHAPTRLDRMIADQLPENGVIRVADLRAPDGSPRMINALKARAQELERLGLARSVRRNVLEFRSDWQERLKAMELHLDLAKRMAQTRALSERARTANRAASAPPRELGR